MLYEKVATLPLLVESAELHGLERAVSSAFVRKTTVIRLFGGGHAGTGEDVTYDGAAHEELQREGPSAELIGEHTFASFSELLASSPHIAVGYRRWAFESAGLDLALRQANLTLHGLLGLRPRPVTFVVSLRLGDPPSTKPLERILRHQPAMRFKVDPTSSWTEELVAEIAALDCVDAVDLKGAYRGTIVDQPPDARLYRLVAEAFPSAWIEDPDLHDPGCAAVLADHRDRITWDAIVRSVADVDALPFPPRTLNVKPSRFGSAHGLFDFYDACRERGIALYGGGQFELGPGRGHIQYLASLFHAEMSNDVAPGGYNDLEPEASLPGSPLPAPGVLAGITA